MLILGIETSGTTGGAALLEGHRLLASLAFTSSTLYSQRLLPGIEWLLERAEVTTEQLAGIAVSRGPGSFTGLRIGLSAAKAIAYAVGIPIVGINTLEALALRGTCHGMPVCPVLDARQGEVYAALFMPEPADPARDCRDGVLSMPALRRLRDDFAGKAEVVAQWADRPTVFLGEGAFRYRERLQAGAAGNFVLAPSIRNLPSAEEIAWLGGQRLGAGESDDLALLEPDYLRRGYATKSKPPR
jgi:tRNA threonylcarbamoyladenosine biosynthesis protein TsaB